MKECSICKGFHSDLLQHMHECINKFKRETTMQRKWCDICKRFYVNIGQHIRDKHEPVYYPCDQCVKKFKRKGDMETHKRSVHSQEREEEILKDHEKREEYNFPCHICKKRFRVRQYLNAHVEGCHPTQFFKCSTTNAFSNFCERASASPMNKYSVLPPRSVKTYIPGVESTKMYPLKSVYKGHFPRIFCNQEIELYIIMIHCSVVTTFNYLFGRNS